MAPINLPDGSQVSEIVLPDGSTASKVLAPDGSTVFGGIPDSVIAQYDAQQESGTATGLSTITDRSGNGFDLAGSVDVDSDGPNNTLSYDFSTSQDAQNTSINVSEPLVVGMVVKQDGGLNTRNYYWDDVNTGNYRVQNDSNYLYQFYDDSNFVQSQGSGDASTYHIVFVFCEVNATDFGLSNSTAIEEDGTVIASGDTSGSNSVLDGLILANSSSGGNNMDVSYSEFLVYGDPTKSEIDSERSRLSDKYGITV